VKPAVARVQSAIDALGLAGTIIELDRDARTSQQAADALGVGVAQIVKSLVFTVNGRPLMVLASGANRVDEAKLGRLADGAVRRADPDTVKQATGYTIGGVPPFGHASALPVYIDRDLLQYERLFCAAGVPECVFPLTPDELVDSTGGQVEDLRAAPPAPRAP
jgi:prolyl-tRNA editing enzyme YbaK/EbsC (Cys-tRNA(Pro) deacylase)